jgi:hypothetical protein
MEVSMQRIVRFIYGFVVFFFLITCLGCPHDTTSETRTRLHRTNLVGIAGEPSTEPYIEIQYSKADLTAFGVNKTETLLVTPPYLFQNNQVYMKYTYSTMDDDYFYATLLHDYAEGGGRVFAHY